MDSRLRIFLMVLLLSIFSHLFAQQEVSWTISTDSKTINYIADIEDGWHIYSQYTNPDVGPIPTKFTIKKNNIIRRIGKVIEPAPIKAYDDNFGGDVMYFESKAEFTQELILKSSGYIKGTITYMVCNDQKCLPPTDVNFEIEIKE